MLLNFDFLLFYINFISFIRPAKERRRGKAFPPLGHTLNNKNTVHWYSMILPSATPPPNPNHSSSLEFLYSHIFNNFFLWISYLYS